MMQTQLKTRILETAAKTPAGTRRQEAALRWQLIGGAIAIALVIFSMRGGMRVTGRPWSLVVGTTLGTAVIAAMGLWVTVGRGGSMLGRPRTQLLFTVFCAPLMLMLWKVAWSAQFDEALDRWPTRVGYRCLVLSLSVGVLPFLALLFSRRRTDPAHPRTSGMSIGAGVGLAGAVLVDMWCPVAYMPHLLLGHVLPIGILAALGFALGQRMLAPRHGGRIVICHSQDPTQ